VSPDSAGRGLTCRLAAPAMAGCGLMVPWICGYWLPVWLPGISLATLMFKCSDPVTAIGSRVPRSAFPTERGRRVSLPGGMRTTAGPLPVIMLFSIRKLAAAAGLSPARVHQITAAATWTSWMPPWASCGPRAGPRPKTPARTTTPSWTGDPPAFLKLFGRMPAGPASCAPARGDP